MRSFNGLKEQGSVGGFAGSFLLVFFFFLCDVMLERDTKNTAPGTVFFPRQFRGFFV